MRKIISKEETGRKRKRNQLIVGGILIFVMLFSTFGYSFYRERGDENNTKKINYNGFEFVKQGDYWVLNIDNAEFIFRYNPKEVLKVYATLNPINNYYGQPLYIYSENKEAELEIYNNLRQVSQRVQYACQDKERCEGDLPVKTCKDNFIIIKNSNYTNIIQEDNCVFINGPEENLTQMADEFLFKIIGVE